MGAKERGTEGDRERKRVHGRVNKDLYVVNTFCIHQRDLHIFDKCITIVLKQ